MKRPISYLAAALIAVAMLTPRADAQTQFMPYLGYDFDVGDGSLLVGVGAEFDLVPVGPAMLALRPSAEYYFVESPTGVDVDFFQINADAILDLAALTPAIGLYGGAGLGIGFSSVSIEGVDESDSETDFGLNVLGGLDVGTGFVTPFIQGRLTIMDGTRFGIQGGVKLTL